MNKIILEDNKLKCLSFLDTLAVSDYLKLASEAYENKGGIQGQRTPLKTKTAQTIRERMVTDISHGAILPPIVVGLIVSESSYERIKNENNAETISSVIKNECCETFSIIDGMQRTTALIEAIGLNPSTSNNLVRVEYWIAKQMNSLIYRMLVLNTGQVPWDIKRQLDTIYEPIVAELKREIPTLDIRLIDQSGRRTDSGQYKSSKLIEYFLCYTSRKFDVEIKEKVAEDFARMDAIAATSDNKLLDDFISIVKLMVSLDHALSRAEKADSLGRFKSGKDIFTSVPAGVGFVSAAAVYIYGPPGFESTAEEISANKNDLINKVHSFITMLESLDEDMINSMLEFDLLNEKISAKSGKIGTFEREFFFKAFETLFKYTTKMTSFKPCWSAR